MIRLFVKHYILSQFVLFQQCVFLSQFVFHLKGLNVLWDCNYFINCGQAQSEQMQILGFVLGSCPVECKYAYCLWPVGLYQDTSNEQNLIIQHCIRYGSLRTSRVECDPCSALYRRVTSLLGSDSVVFNKIFRLKKSKKVNNCMCRINLN